METLPLCPPQPSHFLGGQRPGGAAHEFAQHWLGRKTEGVKAGGQVDKLVGGGMDNSPGGQVDIQLEGLVDNLPGGPVEDNLLGGRVDSRLGGGYSVVA